MFLIGVTGGIGAGKTTVLREFSRLGSRTLDADDIVHGLYEPGSVVCAALRERWGQRVFDASGAVDRAAVARVAFASADELGWLNRLIHPLVKQAMQDEADRSDVGLLCGVPLLFEVGWDRMMSRTVVVWCSREVQDRRLRQRGWDEADIRQRLAHQMDMDRKLSLADYGIINNGSRCALREQCTSVLGSLRRDAARRGHRL